MINDKATVAAALIAALLAAQPASAEQHARHHRARAAAPEHKIACTVVGCIPVPAGCEPVEGRTPGGMPTGFDVIACPPPRH
jgi:hypothetical protein